MSKRSLGIAAAMLLSGPPVTCIAAALPSNDYSKPETWLCHPDKPDGACHGPLNVLVVGTDGHVKPQLYKADDHAKIDCFYVYPTASEDRTPNSDMTPGREVTVAAAQFGQFGAHCRQFAPIYRSETSWALRLELVGQGPDGIDRERAYHDVLDAWNYYLAHDNHGRGVVLVGHSQGSSQLARLVREEIDGKKIQQQIVSAVLAGWPIQVPRGSDVGGTFKSMPLCTRADQFGCVLSWSSFRAELPPSVDPPARFGRGTDGMEAACTNPAALGSDRVVALDAYLPSLGTNWTSVDTVDTNHVRVPQLVSGQCVTRGEFHYLQVTVNADPKDPRSDTIPGDVIRNGKPDARWGLHTVDVALVLGNLLDTVDSQGKAWLEAGH
jgi:hypothetical protein